MGFPCDSLDKESACNAGDLGSIPGLGRSPGEGKGYPLWYFGLENSMNCIVHGVAKSWTWLNDFHFHFIFTVCVYGVSLVAQLVNDLPAKLEALVWFLGWEVPLEKEYSSILGLSWWLRWQRICLQCGRPGFGSWVGKIPWRRAWQPTPVFLPGVSPWTEEPGGLQSMESHRVGHDWTTKNSTVRIC